MVASLRLAEKSAQITATAPALIASRNEERVREQERLVQRMNELAAAVTEDLEGHGRIRDEARQSGRDRRPDRNRAQCAERRHRAAPATERARDRGRRSCRRAHQVPRPSGAFGGRRRLRPRDHQRGGDSAEQGGDHRPGRGRGECLAGPADAARRGQLWRPACWPRRRASTIRLIRAHPRAVLGGGGDDREESRGVAGVARERAAARGERSGDCARRGADNLFEARRRSSGRWPRCATCSRPGGRRWRWR